MKKMETVGESGQGIERQSKLKKIKLKLDQFKRNIDIFKAEDKNKIEEALDLMLELHIDQRDRPSGMPYIGHPLEVADDLIVRFGIKDKDIIIAALMHDSVEDQSHLLSEKYLARRGQDLEKGDSEKENSLCEIEEAFGLTVRTIVNALTNPDFSKPKSKMTSNEIYKKHVEAAIIDPQVCVVKYADFACNALAIHGLDEGERKQHFREKYEPVIQDVFLPLFEAMTEEHPLFSKRDEIIEELRGYYEKNYFL